MRRHRPYQILKRVERRRGCNAAGPGRGGRAAGPPAGPPRSPGRDRRPGPRRPDPRRAGRPRGGKPPARPPPEGSALPAGWLRLARRTREASRHGERAARVNVPLPRAGGSCRKRMSARLSVCPRVPSRPTSVSGTVPSKVLGRIWHVLGCFVPPRPRFHEEGVGPPRRQGGAVRAGGGGPRGLPGSPRPRPTRTHALPSRPRLPPRRASRRSRSPAGTVPGSLRGPRPPGVRAGGTTAVRRGRA